MTDIEDENLANSRESFDKVVDFSMRVSLEMNGKPATQQTELASFVHTKMCITSTSVEHMFEAKFADHSAIMALCRMLMEGSNFFMYIMELTSDEEWKCRYLCMRLHDTVNRIKLLSGFQSQNEYADMTQGREDLKRDLQANSFFRGLPLERRNQLLTGDHFYVRGSATAAKNAGWNYRKFLALYSYLSSHAHSAPMSFFRVKQHNVNWLEPSGAQKAAVVTALGVAEYSLIKATLTYLELHTESKAKFDAKELADFASRRGDWRSNFEEKN